MLSLQYIGGSCMKPLLNWVKWHFDGVNHSVHSLLSTDDPYTDPIYWNTVRNFEHFFTFFDILKK